MSAFWIVFLSALGLFLFIAVLSAVILRMAIGKKPIVDLKNGKLIKKTQLGPHIPILLKGLEQFDRISKERICIKSRDGLNLVAYYIPCENKSNKFALLMHGYFSCGKIDFAVGIEYFHKMGYNLLLPDQRAHGESEGRYIGFGILERYDCKLWAEYLTKRFGSNIQIVLGGISMGASTVLMASGLELPDTVKCIYADSAFTSPVNELKFILRKYLHMPSFPVIYGAGIMCRRFGGYDINECSTVEVLKKAKKPVLFIHGKADKLVPSNFSEENYTACASEKMLFMVDGAMHVTSFFIDNQGYRNKLKEFLEKYIS